MKSDRAVPVAIVGGGFSGTILAAQLARRAIRSAMTFRLPNKQAEDGLNKR